MYYMNVYKCLCFLLHTHMYISSAEEYVMSTCARFYETCENNNERIKRSKL